MVEIARGAEAVLVKEGNNLLKKRIPKTYRNPEIDGRIRKQRTKIEAKILKTLERNGVKVPRVVSVDEENSVIVMEFIDGKKAKDCFSLSLVPKIAEGVSLIHSAGVIHGDITTSNIIVNKGEIFFVDFGLAKFSKSVEDRAVDIRLFQQALESTHTRYSKRAFELFLRIYGKKFPDVVFRLGKVNSRGRYCVR